MGRGGHATGPVVSGVLGVVVCGPAAGWSGWVVRPTLPIAANSRLGWRPPMELMKMAVTEAAIAAIAPTGCTSPVAARGMPMPLKVNAIPTFCFTRR